MKLLNKIKEKLERADSTKLSKTLFIIFNCLILIGIITVATFAWIPSTIRKAYQLTYENNLLISSLDINILLECYDDDAQEYVTIAKYEDGSTTNYDSAISFRLNPGDKMSYAFTVKNNSETSVLTCDVTFEGFQAFYDILSEENPYGAYDPESELDIFDYLSIHIVSPNAMEIPKLSEAFDISYTGTKNLIFMEDLTLEPEEEITFNWYISLSADAGNEFWGTRLKFADIFFGI